MHALYFCLIYDTCKNTTQKKITRTKELYRKNSPQQFALTIIAYTVALRLICAILSITQPNLQLFKYKIVCIKFSFSIRFSYEKINVKIYTKRRVFSAFFSTLKHRMLTTCYLVHRENLN